MTSHPGETSAGARAMALVDALARHTNEPGRLTRLYLSPAHRATAEATLGMMREAGLRPASMRPATSSAAAKGGSAAHRR